MFYTDYPKSFRPLHYKIIVFSHAYMLYSEYGYVETIDYDHVVWC